ncbi:hypothetical protein HU200_022692 [Digitaria exilis]|uniref:DEK n=1 Tax=Digitaria exilis TaxID=1010633 RepID=A0A835C749_9POAL|nr:hypothetical protein HU200_022692 [Digitaria exilis]
MEEKAVANGAAADDVAAPENKDSTNKEEAGKGKESAVVNKDAEEQNKGSENGTEGPPDGDVKMAETETAKEGDGDAAAAEQVDPEDVKMDTDAKEDTNDKTEEGEDAKMTEAEAEAENTEVKDKEEKEDKVDHTNVDKLDESKEQEKVGSAEQEENDGKETEEDEKEEKDGDDEKQQEEEAEEKGSADKKDEDDKVEEDKETPKNKKARSARDRSQGKDKKQEGSRSREAKSLLETSSPYGTDRPQRERKTVERLVEVIEKEPNKNFVVEKGRGTPLKDIPSVAHRIARKKPSDLKFLHSILFGRKGKLPEFKGHILQFSGFVWHESDEKQRAKAKEKLDKCVKDMLLDLCWILAIPVPKSNVRKEDIISKLLDFIAEPHSATDSGLSDDQGSNSRKRKRGGESASKTPESTPSRSRKAILNFSCLLLLQKFGDDSASGKRRKKALKYDSDEDEDGDDSMKSDSEADEQEDDYDSGKEKARKKFPEVNVSSGKKMTDRGRGHKAGPQKTISKSPVKKVSSKISEEKESPDDSAKVFSRKKKPTGKDEKDIKEKKSSGKKVTKGKGESTGVDLPSKDELRKTIIAILKKVDFNTVSIF